MRPTSLMVWCGERNGRVRTSALPGQQPRDAVDLRDFQRLLGVSAGRIVGSRFASMVLPEPGGPIIITLCPPAAATSSARLTCSWPFTSAKSTSYCA